MGKPNNSSIADPWLKEQWSLFDPFISPKYHTHFRIKVFNGHILTFTLHFISTLSILKLQIYVWAAIESYLSRQSWSIWKETNKILIRHEGLNTDKKSLKVPKGQSESVYRTTDNTMAKRKNTKWQTTIFKTYT